MRIPGTHLKLTLCSETNNYCVFASVIGPKQVLNKIIKLNRIEFQKKTLVIDEGKKKSSTPSLTPLRQYPVDASQKSQKQTAFNRTAVVPEHKSFSKVKKSKSNNSYNTLIFQMYQFNRTLRINKLDSYSNNAIEWFKMNKMIVNSGKSQVIVLNKKHSNLTNTKFQVDNQVMKLVSSQELLGIQIDDKFHFNLHINKVYKCAANRLNALIRLKRFMRKKF